MNNLKFKQPLYSRRKKPISNESLNSLSQYLNNPIATGIWRLNCDWIEQSEFSNKIWRTLESEVKEKTVVTIKSNKRLRKINIDDEVRAKFQNVIFRTISFPFFVAAYLAEQDGLLLESSLASSDISETVSLIFELVDIKTTRELFSDAYELFKKEILTDKFNPNLFTKGINTHKLGSLMILSGPREGEPVTIVSWDGQPLRVISEFLEKLGVIENISLMPIFSPEEELFEPYFDILDLTYASLIKQTHLHPTIEKAIKHYIEGNYIDCVSSIGLGGEDVLTQIFETLFREQLSKGLTLGQLLDEIQRRVSSLYKAAEELPPDLSIVYGKIKSAIDGDEDKGAAALDIIRQLATLQIELNKFNLAKLEKIGRTEKAKSILPVRVLNCTNDIIRYRNASSHKSRVPIGPYESKRSAYSFIVLYLWWESEKRAIDWTLSPEKIIRSIVTRNS